MPRLPRIHVEGSVYYVTSRGSQDQQIFKDKADYQMYIDLLTKYKSQHKFKLFAYALSADKISLLIETGDDATISDIMHDLNSLYTKHFNGKYDRRGSLFESRFKSVLVEKAAHLLEMTRHIHRQDAVETSYAFYAGLSTSSGMDISGEIQEVKNFLIAKNEPGAYEKYCVSLTEDEVADFAKKMRGSVMGSDQFAAEVKNRIHEISNEKEREVPGKRKDRTFLYITAGTAVLITAYSVNLYITKEDLKSKLEGRNVEFAEKSRFENRSPIALKELEDTQWQIDLVQMKAEKSAAVQDVVRFNGGRFSSDLFMKRGYRDSSYFLVPKGNGVVEWHASQSTSAGETVIWSGVWQGDIMKGSATVTVKGEPAGLFSFYSVKWSYRDKAAQK